jgi:hypothetical protein
MSYYLNHFYVFAVLHLIINYIFDLKALNFDLWLLIHPLGSFWKIISLQMDLITMVFEFWINLQATAFLIVQNFLIFEQRINTHQII